MNEQTTAKFSNREELDQIGEYRRVNAAGVLSLLLGIASAGALIHPNVWVVNFAAILLGMTGLWMTNRNDNMGGRFASWAGIALGLFFLAWAASQFIAHRMVLYGEAQAVAEDWLQLVVEGEDKIAHQAMLHPASRQATGFSVDDYYAMDENANTARKNIFGTKPASEILGIGGDAKIQHTKNVTQDVDLKYGKLILLEYRLTGKDKEPVDALLTIARSYKPELGRATWIVADIGLPR